MVGSGTGNISVKVVGTEGAIGASESGRDEFVRDGIEREGIAREGIAREGVAREGIAREGMAREGMAREGTTTGGVERDRFAGDGIESDGNESDGIEREGGVIGIATVGRATVSFGALVNDDVRLVMAEPLTPRSVTVIVAGPGHCTAGVTSWVVVCRMVSRGGVMVSVSTGKVSSTVLMMAAPAFAVAVIRSVNVTRSVDISTSSWDRTMVSVIAGRAGSVRVMAMG